MTYNYVPSGVCSRQIKFEIDNGIVHGVEFIAGCNGNGQGVGRLCEGMKVEEVIERLESISCNGKPTSCPAQLAKALKATLQES